MSETEVLTTEELAELLRVPVHTVHYWRSKGTGPKGARIGKRVVYRRAGVDEWLDKRADADEMNTRTAKS